MSEPPALLVFSMIFKLLKNNNNLTEELFVEVFNNIQKVKSVDLSVNDRGSSERLANSIWQEFEDCFKE